MYGVDFPPVCSIMGGLVAQELFKGITHVDMPVHNILCTTQRGTGAVVFHLPAP